MAESLKTILMSALASKATPAESDTLIVGYIYINPPDTNNDYYLIGATNVDWNACPVSIVAVSRQNSTHIVHFTSNIENSKSVRILSMWTQAKYITFKS